MWWKQLLLTITLVISTTYAIKPQNDNLNQVHQQIKSDVLNNHSLKLAFNEGQFFTWNTGNNLKMVAGIFTTTNQSYLLNTNGIYNNLDLQISNFIAINDNLGIVTCNNYHMPNGNHYLNKSFLMNEYGTINSLVSTVNSTFTKWDDKVVSTGVGADLITSNGNVSPLVAAYTYGYGTTNFTAINKNYGVFVGGDQKCYLLKSNKVITRINNASGQQIVVSNPNITKYFVSLNDNGGIIRDKDGQLLYLTIDSSGTIKTYLLTINPNIKPLVSTTINFFTPIDDHKGIINISFENSSNKYGQPYLIDATNPMNVIFTKITNHLMNNFVLLHNDLGVFIDDNQNAWFLKPSTLQFNNIGNATNFQTINNHLGLLTTPTSTLLLSDKPNREFANINTISWTKNQSNQDSTFINTYFNFLQPNFIDRTNSWISDGALTLSVTNEKLINVIINGSQTLIPDSNNNITTTIFIKGNNTINFNFSDISSLIYHVLIYNTPTTLPTLDNSTNTNYKYVGINNKQLYDMNSTNTSDGFTVNFKYDNTIQFVNIITLDESNMNKINLWTIKPGTTFQLPTGKNSLTYCIQTVSWSNIIDLKYFTITNGSSLPITEFWKSDEGINLLKRAIKFGYTESRLFAMNAIEITNLESLADSWTIKQIGGDILGYIISGFLSVGVIIAIIALGYDWYLKKYLILPNYKGNLNNNNG